MKATPGRPVLTLVPPWTEPDHRHGPRWWWFRVTEAWETARWHILTALAAAVAIVVPRVHGRAWTEGFTTTLGGPPVRTWRQHLDSWRQGNEVAAEIVHRRHGHRVKDGRLTLCCPFVLPDPAGLSALVAQVADEQLAEVAAWQAARAADQGVRSAATPGGRWRALRRIGAAVAVMATAAVTADSQRVTALADVVAPRRIVVIEGRHAAGPGHPGRQGSDRSRPAGRHVRPRWRNLAARWIRDAIGWRETGAHRTTNGPLRTAA